MHWNVNLLCVGRRGAHDASIFMMENEENKYAVRLFINYVASSSRRPLDNIYVIRVSEANAKRGTERKTHSNVCA